jgi:hypothetical protein
MQPTPRTQALRPTPHPQFAMKNLLILPISLLLLAACQKEKVEKLETDGTTYPQTWQLVQMSGNFPPVTKTGADLPWQETYVVQADSTFTKTRQQGTQRKEASGTFSIRNGATGLALILTYPADNDILTNCSAAPKEGLLLQENGILMGSAAACDGPRLEYKRSK